MTSFGLAPINEYIRLARAIGAALLVIAVLSWPVGADAAPQAKAARQKKEAPQEKASPEANPAPGANGGLVANADPLPGFQDSVVISGLTQPMAMEFAQDGRLFVAEKSGVIKVFDSIADPSPDVFADLGANVHNYWDRGLMGMTLDPDFPAEPYIYALYTYDAPIGGAAPTWGNGCPTPPGPTTDGCVVSGRVSRLEANGNFMTGSEQVLVNDWCQQYPSHSVGTVAFGSDGALYVGGGDGAAFHFVDYGQRGNPTNPCGDPPSGVGGTQTPPTAEGGALRAQDVRTTGDPTGLNGSIIRINPDTGAPMPGNPAFGNADVNRARMVSHGFRNPFRFTFRPGTNEIWIGDVGYNDFEEIDRLAAPTGDSTIDNFGWPCYEGAPRQGGYDGANLDLCESLYTQSGAVADPYFSYGHSSDVVPGDGCALANGSALSGLAFYEGGPYPDSYDGALFFSDYSRDCIWVMPTGSNGLPSASKRALFIGGAANPVQLQTGPNGDLFYVDLDGGQIHRIVYGDTGGTGCPDNEFKAEYFSNKTLSGSPTFSQCEATIDHDWPNGTGPGNGVGNNYFSTRFTGNHSFAAGDYVFTARADDGVRMWVDDILIIDAWINQGATTYTATRTMTAGFHEVRVEYYENTWDAEIHANWQQS